MTPLLSILTQKPHRDTLLMVGRYHYVTARQCQRYLGYANKQFANKILKELTEAGYLANANWVPKGRSPGQPEYVWSLRPKGYRALAQMDVEVAKRLSYTLDRSQYFMAHTQAINDTLIASELFALEEPNVELTGFLHEESFKRAQLNPTPDGWVRYKIGDTTGAILWEIDRGTEDKRKWTQKVIAYCDFLEGPENVYKELGGDEPVQVAIVVRSNPTQRTKAPEERCAELLEWAEIALSSDWGPLFSFTPVDPVSVTPREFFTDPHWFSPHDTTPTSLIPRERL